MIYLDTSATSFQKPHQVREAVFSALENHGNAGRSITRPALTASRSILKARMTMAKLLNVENPMNIAFTSGATESLNLIVKSLVLYDQCVLTTEMEHNSVLRPLYLSGAKLSFIPCDDEGVLNLTALSDLSNTNPKVLFATHGSNVTGRITPVHELYNFCKKENILFVLDVSQTLGSIPVTGGMADILCFTGHKGLFGPQGTGGIVVKEGLSFPLVKTGGSGGDSFQPHQPLTMPDVFEAGTANSHGLAGLTAGVAFVLETGLQKIQDHERELSKIFYNNIKSLPFVTLYGPATYENRLPVFSFNIHGFSSDEVVVKLWENYSIATRGGSHCAPLVHKKFNTVDIGMVRISFGYFNTSKEICKAIHAIKEIGNEKWS